MEGPRAISFEEDACWVCLEGPSQAAGVLEHPCACPRGVHAKCLARWQLQSAGRDEERFCRFCKNELPDWRDILTPKVPAAPPVMAIVYDGKVVRLQVKPGREGMEEFQRQVRKAFNLGEDVELDCVFDCRAPGTGEKIKLRGLESYSAAMHCAAVAAGERLAKMKNGSSSGATRPAGASTSASTSIAAAAAAGASAAPAVNASPSNTGSQPPTPRRVSATTTPAPYSSSSGSSPRGDSASSPVASSSHRRISRQHQQLHQALEAHAQATCVRSSPRSHRNSLGGVGGGSEGLMTTACASADEVATAVPAVGGSGVGSPAAAGAAGSSGRKRSLLSGLFKSLSSARRVM